MGHPKKQHTKNRNLKVFIQNCQPSYLYTTTTEAAAAAAAESKFFNQPTTYLIMYNFLCHHV
jgi:hypothetical protein